MAGCLVLVLGDQLDRGGAAFDGFDRGRDRVWMAEVAQEKTHVIRPISDGISVELLQKGQALEPREPWLSMENTGAR